MKVSILTLGCKVNQAESQEIESYLRAAGWSIVDLSENPDLCIINSCTVTAKSDYQSRQLIRRAAKAGSKVILTGCYSEIMRDTASRMDGVYKVVPNDKKDLIFKDLIGNISSNTFNYTGKSRYFLKIQDGCNHSCSYCIIPAARGRSRSIQPEVIIERLQYISPYYNEVVLTAIHLGTYGYDLKPRIKLSKLIRMILKETPIKRIRLSSLEIREIDDELLELLNEARVCDHLHIPLQSGDDNILKMMKRNYRIDEYLKVVFKIFERYPDISIGTDVIVGFPGEGEEEFNNTRKVIEGVPFSYLHVFPYSIRKGTEAAGMRQTVREEIKKQRASIIRQIGQQKKLDYMRHQIGRVLDVLVERRVNDNYIGISSNYLRIKTTSKDVSIKDIVRLRVSEIINGELFGHRLGN